MNSNNGRREAAPPGAPSLFSIALILCLLLLPVRAAVMNLSLLVPPRPDHVPLMVLMGYYDVAYVASITALFGILFSLFRRNPKARKRLTLIFFVIAFFSLLAGILNIEVTKKLGTPFNYRWLYYSDFLMSHDRSLST